jgi:hypothetical protein
MLYPALLGIFSMTKYSLTLPKPSPNPNIIIKYKILISMGVSICLDVVLMETLDLNTGKRLVSTVGKISTLSKS